MSRDTVLTMQSSDVDPEAGLAVASDKLNQHYDLACNYFQSALPPGMVGSKGHKHDSGVISTPDKRETEGYRQSVGRIYM